MAGGPNTPELVSEVSRSGGLGVLGLTGMSLDAATAATREAIAGSGGAPVGVNAQLAPRSPATGDPERIAAVLAGFRQELGLWTARGTPHSQAAAPLELLEAGVVSGRFDDHDIRDPSPAIPLARRAGIPLLAMVTTPGEATLAVAAGADGVIAQGSEAGGHRSAFSASTSDRHGPKWGRWRSSPRSSMHLDSRCRWSPAAASWTAAGSPPRSPSELRVSRWARASSSRARAASPSATGERSPNARPTARSSPTP